MEPIEESWWAYAINRLLGPSKSDVLTPADLSNEQAPVNREWGNEDAATGPVFEGGDFGGGGATGTATWTPPPPDWDPDYNRWRYFVYQRKYLDITCGVERPGEKRAWVPWEAQLSGGTFIPITHPSTGPRHPNWRSRPTGTMQNSRDWNLWPTPDSAGFWSCTPGSNPLPDPLDPTWHHLLFESSEFVELSNAICDDPEHVYATRDVVRIGWEPCEPEVTRPSMTPLLPFGDNPRKRVRTREPEQPPESNEAERERERQQGRSVGLPIGPFLTIGPAPIGGGGLPPALPPLPRPPGRPSPSKGRNPPKKRQKESGKKGGPLRTILKIVDFVSERSEDVDCVYAALPKSVRQKWGKGRQNRGLLDNAGQYGIDGADWKLQAIWHNHDKVDWDQALECMVINQIEDKVIGAFQRQLRKASPIASSVTAREIKRREFLKKQREIKARVRKWKRENAEHAERQRRENAKRRFRSRSAT